MFDVHVGDELVFEKSMLGRYPDPEDVMPLLRPRLAARRFCRAARRPSFGISPGARDATKVWNCGRIGIAVGAEADRHLVASGQPMPNRLEPQTEQNAFTRPPSGLKTRISSSPANRRKPERGTRPCVPPKAPECLRQREQWQ